MNLSKEKITALLKGVGDDHKKDVGQLECSFLVVQKEKDILGGVTIITSLGICI